MSLANDVDIAVALETLLPSKGAKWASWAQILRDAGINVVGDVRGLSSDAWASLNLSPVLKSGVGLLRESPAVPAAVESPPPPSTTTTIPSSTPSTAAAPSSEASSPPNDIKDNTTPTTTLPAESLPPASSDTSSATSDTTTTSATTSEPSTTTTTATTADSAAASASSSSPSAVEPASVASSAAEPPASSETPLAATSLSSGAVTPSSPSSAASTPSSPSSTATQSAVTSSTPPPSTTAAAPATSTPSSTTRRLSLEDSDPERSSGVMATDAATGKPRGHVPSNSMTLTDTMKTTSPTKLLLDNLKVGRVPALVAMLHREAIHFSGVVSKINGLGRTQTRALIITEKAVYNCLEKSFAIKRRIPFESIAAITVSRGSGEFVIHVPFEYDYHYTGVYKEDVQVVLNWSFEQFAANFPRELRDDQTHLVTNFTSDSKLGDRVMTEERSKIFTKADREIRWAALQTSCVAGDHLHFSALPAIHRLLRELGDNNPKPEEVRFSAHVQKVNKKGLNQNRIFLMTDKAVYNIVHPKMDEYKCQRRIAFHEIAALTLSSQPQSTEFVLHLAKDYDYHFLSPNKSEIKDILSREYALYATQHGSKFSMAQSNLAVALKTEARLREHVLTKDMAAQMDEKLRQKRMRDIVLNANLAQAKAEAEAAAAAQKMSESK